MKQSYNDRGLTAKRSCRLLAVGLTALCAVSAPALFAQDFARMGERSIMGTARYVGMGGAMTAIGADPSAAQDNPAGLGLYRRFEALLTLGGAFDRTLQSGQAVSCQTNRFEMPQASAVFSFPTYAGSGVQFHNFLVSYRRLHSYSRLIKAYGTDDPSLGALMDSYPINIGMAYAIDPLNRNNQMTLTESGYVDEYAFDYAMNINDQWYVGLGMQIQSYLLSSKGDYYEQFARLSADGKYFDNENETDLILSGAGCTFSAGLIYRPLSWLRLGAGIQTPSLGGLRTSSYGKFSSQTDTLLYSDIDDSFYDNTFHMPLHLSTSVAFQVGGYGLLSLQYDYRHGKAQADVHSLRTGIEIIPVMGLYINAGYACESTFKPNKPALLDSSFVRQDTYTLLPRWSQYASAAIGYRGKHFIGQVAYQYRWQRVDLFAHEAAEPYDILTNTHRIVVTIGWHSD